jgi:hypothetical protein
MKKIIMLLVLAVLLIPQIAEAQSGIRDQQVSAEAAIKMSKVKPVQFSSAPSAATWFNATLKALAKGDFYLNTTSNTFHYYNGSAWMLVVGGSGAAIYAGADATWATDPTYATYLAGMGRVPVVNDLVFGTTSKSFKRIVSIGAGPGYVIAYGNPSFDKGTSAAPGLTFVGDTDTGVSAETVNTLILSAGGAANTLTLSTTALTSTVPLVFPAGAAWSFAGDADSGVTWTGGNSYGFYSNAAAVMNITAATVTIPTGVVLAHTDAPAADTTVANKAYVDNALLFGTKLTPAAGVQVNLGAIAVTPLYTCPAGRTCSIEKIVFRSASASVDQAADATYNIGWQAVASGVVASVALVNPTATTTSWHPVVVGVGSAAEQTLGAATEVLNFNVTAACTTSPTTIRVDVFGYSY